MSILVIGGVAGGRRVEYIGRTARIDGEPYTHHGFNGVQVYAPKDVTHEMVRRALQELGLIK